MYVTNQQMWTSVCNGYVRSSNWRETGSEWVNEWMSGNHSLDTMSCSLLNESTIERTNINEHRQQHSIDPIIIYNISCLPVWINGTSISVPLVGKKKERKKWHPRRYWHWTMIMANGESSNPGCFKANILNNSSSVCRRPGGGEK